MRTSALDFVWTSLKSNVFWRKNSPYANCSLTATNIGQEVRSIRMKLFGKKVTDLRHVSWEKCPILTCQNLTLPPCLHCLMNCILNQKWRPTIQESKEMAILLSCSVPPPPPHLPHIQERERRNMPGHTQLARCRCSCFRKTKLVRREHSFPLSHHCLDHVMPKKSKEKFLWCGRFPC